MVKSIDTNIVGKNDNDFSLLSTIFSLVGNRKFVNDYSNCISAMHSVRNQNTDLWVSLSAIGQQIGGEFQANINNFIDNIVNIDTCGTKGLESIAQLLGTNYNIFNTIRSFPIDIVKLIDIFSMKKEYLASMYHVKRKLAEFMTDNCSIAFSQCLLSTVSSVNEARLSALSIDNSISDDWMTYKNGKFDNCMISSVQSLSGDLVDACISATFYDFMCQQLSITYNDSNQTLVYEDLSDSILLSDFALPNDYIDDIKALQLKYNIPYSFDVEAEVDKIDDGLSKYDDYSKLEKNLIDLELRRRSDQYSQSELSTRYKYYRQKTVKEYFQTITLHQNLILDTYLSAMRYAVDEQYFTYDLSSSPFAYLSTDGNSHKICLQMNYIYAVVDKLMYITDSLRSVREMLKFFCQKNFMKGTFLLISYLVNEYLKSNTLYNMKILCNTDDIQYNPNTNYSEITHYVDPLQYFNISSDVDYSMLSENENLSSALNSRYWQSDDAVTVSKQNDTTNIFIVPPKINAQSFAFSIETLSDFYCNYLGNKFENYKLRSLSSMTQTDHLVSFLTSIFDLGADKSFKSFSGKLVTATDKQLSAYKEDLYYRYTGNTNSENPFYYYDNTIHPSYQIHPFLSNFMEVYDFSYPIQNIATIAKDEILQLVKNKIDQYIDDDGYIIHMWKNPLGANQDYMSRYESATNINDVLIEDPKVAYDGIFYPLALNLISSDFNDVISMISNDVKEDADKKINYFYGLSLTEKDRQKTIQQLSAFREYIFDEAKNDFKDKHIIYKYGLDMYQNAYMLIKEKKDDYKEQQTAPGTLLIKLKNHPVAFPALVYDDDKNRNNNDLAQLYEHNVDDMSVIDTNNEITNSAKRHQIKSGSSCFYVPSIEDFYIATSKQDILLSYRTKDDKLAISLCLVKKVYDKIEDQHFLQFDNVGIVNGNNLFAADHKDVKLGCFYENNSNPGAITYRIQSQTAVELHNSYYETSVRDNGKIYHYDFTCNLACPICSADNVKYDVCIAATDNNTATLAYIGDTQLSTVSSYLDNSFNYLSNDDVYGKHLTMQLDRCIVTKDFSIYKSFSEKQIDSSDNADNSSQYFNCFTDAGFFGIFQNANDISNVIAGTCLEEELHSRGILKFQLLGNSKLSELSIDFKLCLPVAMQENYALNGNVHEIDGHKYVTYKLAHFLEDQAAATNGSQYTIDDNQYFYPTFVNRLLNGKDASVKVVEDYFNLMRKQDTEEYDGQSLEDMFYRLYKDAANGPYLLCGDFPTKYFDTTTITADPGILSSDNFVISISSGKKDISVSWCINNENTIELDFNSYYYDGSNVSALFGNAQIHNYFNEKRVFLNLTFPGEGGYLNTYDEYGIYEATYYIKNISDQHPKFILADCTVHDDSKTDFLMSQNKEDGFVIQEDKEDSSSEDDFRIIV